MANSPKTPQPATSLAAPAAAPTMVATMTEQTDQAISLAKNGMEQVAAKSREAMEQGLKSIDAMTAMSRGNVDAMLESSRAATGAFQSLAEEVAQYSKHSTERATAAMRAMAQAKTVPELMQVQGDFARTEFTTAIAETTRLVQTVFATMSVVVAPLQSRALAVATTEESPAQS